MRQKTYVIECRTPGGALDFADPQPEQVFGMAAIHGIKEDHMAKLVFAHLTPQSGNVVLTGANVLQWPSFLDPRWSAREKTW